MPENGPTHIGSQFREKLEAKALLLRLRNLESAAVRAETSSVQAWRKLHAEAYRKVIGVDPVDRSSLRVAAERIAAGSGGNVMDVIANINANSLTQKESP